ncbi:tyrosine-type recombinase/integrase, partial [Putridiphycobacter roseus]|uniref:tyrosine-type recombinase/integrase n=1 Tax=Putridiphycobacter roseus TaxID=2219161 RepID=UPI0036423D37
MNAKQITKRGYGFKEAEVVKIEGLSKLLERFTKRIGISYTGSSTLKSYRRAVRDLSLFNGALPNDLEVDQILDYLHELRTQGLSWAKIKIDVAGLKFFYREMTHDTVKADHIPYPKEEKSLPKLLSREELLQLFDAALNPKHRLILRLIYGSGLRRSEVINLRIDDIDTRDGKCRIRINKSKGAKDRYTVLSTKVLEELRTYFLACRPKVYLFNGQKKGQPVSFGLLRHITLKAIERSGITKPVNLHILRHCFASHA